MGCPNGNCLGTINSCNLEYHNPNGTWSAVTPGSITNGAPAIKDWRVHVNFHCNSNFPSTCNLRTRFGLASSPLSTGHYDSRYFPEIANCEDYNSYCTNSDIDTYFYFQNYPALTGNCDYTASVVLCDPCNDAPCSGCANNPLITRTYYFKTY